ncbi:uncharacterized protein LOC135141132 isoform X2 [Zophobas morio]|uniref:uncharacterized protein LOC135141132 isoform X2 n=1 Tax=Zophobas morio TaxID=2755281 RepID=UPI003082C4F8
MIDGVVCLLRGLFAGLTRPFYIFMATNTKFLFFVSCLMNNIEAREAESSKNQKLRALRYSYVQTLFYSYVVNLGGSFLLALYLGDGNCKTD